MNNKDKKLLIDLLIYLDISLNWEQQRFLGNDIGNSINVLMTVQRKHKDFPNAEKRHKIISKLITKLEEEQ